MDWVVIQLTPWAEKKMTTRELASEMRRKLKIPDLEVYYPVVEDLAGKHCTPYSEYFFLEYRPDVSWEDLEGTEFFSKMLKTKSGEPQTVTDADLQKIRDVVGEQQRLNPGDVVYIHQGPLRGNDAEVLNEDTQTNQVELLICLGEDEQRAAFPISWVRRKKAIKKRVNSPYMQAPPPPVETPQIPIPVTQTGIEIIRKGPKNTRVLWNGENRLVTNEELAKILKDQPCTTNVT